MFSKEQKQAKLQQLEAKYNIELFHLKHALMATNKEKSFKHSNGGEFTYPNEYKEMRTAALWKIHEYLIELRKIGVKRIPDGSYDTVIGLLTAMYFKWELHPKEELMSFYVAKHMADFIYNNIKKVTDDVLLQRLFPNEHFNRKLSVNQNAHVFIISLFVFIIVFYICFSLLFLFGNQGT